MAQLIFALVSLFVLPDKGQAVGLNGLAACFKKGGMVQKSLQSYLDSSASAWPQATT